MGTRARPLSPHLQIYRWQISNTLSILHRLSGAFLSLGFAILGLWMIALASGPRAYAVVMTLLHNPIGIAACVGWTLAFFFHFLNGIRHLFWDAGVGFDKRRSRASGWVVVIGSLTLTIGTLFWVFK